MGNTKAPSQAASTKNAVGFGIITSGNSQTNNVLMFGMEGAGKTHLLYRMLAGNALSISLDSQRLMPTNGFNTEQVVQDYGTFVVWDFGGNHLMREFWPYYIKNVYSTMIIFVVDVNECIERLRESKRVLHSLLNNPDIEAAERSFELMIVLNNKPNKDQKIPYHDNPFSRDQMIEVLRLGSSKLEKKPHLRKFFKGNEVADNVFEMDVNNDKKCGDFFKEVSKRIKPKKEKQVNQESANA